jgi:hypothetical protein
MPVEKHVEPVVEAVPHREGLPHQVLLAAGAEVLEGGVQAMLVESLRGRNRGARRRGAERVVRVSMSRTVGRAIWIVVVHKRVVLGRTLALRQPGECVILAVETKYRPPVPCWKVAMKAAGSPAVPHAILKPFR